jgi:hypothetical protein
MAFSSKTTYTLYQKKQLYSHQTQDARGKAHGAWFKLSKTITLLEEREKRKGLKNITYVIHILGCM